MILWWYYR